MKWLMKSLRCSPDARFYMQLKRDLGELGIVQIFTYKSKFHPFRESAVILKSESADIHESNHVEYLLDGKIAIQFFKRMWATLGVFSDQNFLPDTNEKIELILLKDGYYTSTTAWKYAPWRPLFLLSIPFIYILCLGLYMFDARSFEKMSLSTILFIGSIISGIILAVFSYRQYFSSR